MTASTNTRVVFARFTNRAGQLAAHQFNGYATTVFRWDEKTEYVEEAPECAAVFGYVARGDAEIRTAVSTYQLSERQFFSVAPPCSVIGGAGLVVRHAGFGPLPLVGGPIEENGRLRYISGCRDTLLIPPLRRGDPCLNALYFPPATDQQPHTHPSIRVGVVARGSGEAVLEDRVEPLNQGDVFVIAPHGLHSFRTRYGQAMTVIAYHPDSDCGPEDDDHPMINRTMIDGISAGRRGLTLHRDIAAREHSADMGRQESRPS